MKICLIRLHFVLVDSAKERISFHQVLLAVEQRLLIVILSEMIRFGLSSWATLHLHSFFIYQVWGPFTRKIWLYMLQCISQDIVFRNASEWTLLPASVRTKVLFLSTDGIYLILSSSTVRGRKWRSSKDTALVCFVCSLSCHLAWSIQQLLHGKNCDILFSSDILSVVSLRNSRFFVIWKFK